MILIIHPSKYHLQQLTFHSTCYNQDGLNDLKLEECDTRSSEVFHITPSRLHNHFT